MEARKQTGESNDVCQFRVYSESGKYIGTHGIKVRNGELFCKEHEKELDSVFNIHALILMN